MNVARRPGPVPAVVCHERGHHPAPGDDFLDPVLVHEPVVGRLESVVVADVQLELPGTGLRVAGLDLDAGLGELVPDGGDQVLVQAAAVDAVGVGPGPDRLQPPARVSQRGEIAAGDGTIILYPDISPRTLRTGAGT